MLEKVRRTMRVMQKSGSNQKLKLHARVRVYFQDSEAVNSALRSLIQLMSKIPPSDKTYVQRKVPTRRIAERK